MDNHLKMKRPGFLKFTLAIGVLAILGGFYFLAIALLPPTAQYFKNPAYLFMLMDFQQVLFSGIILVITGMACILLGTVKPKAPAQAKHDGNA
ncbi:MAG: hypothetical protein VB108_09660 [Anaerolineaceae bacterium]|nr:hypothetical protein [Anaerolineaceae bacterium]